MKTETSPRLVLLVLAAALFPASAFALGSRIPNQDAFAIARGNAFVATADNPAALYYNPAGITQLEGHHFQLGALTYLGIYTDYDSPAGARTENEPELQPVPQLHYTFTPGESPFSFGLGVYAPFGLGIEWPDEAPFRTGGLEARLTYVTFNPVVAWKILPGLSLAAGPTFNYSNAKFRQGIGAVPGDSFVFRGEDYAPGYDIGLLWQPNVQWSFGANYRSATTLNYEGRATTDPSPPLPPPVHTSASFEFPRVITGGISFRPTPKWNLEVDVDWTDWSTLNTVKFEGLPATLPLNWNPSFLYEFGVTRYLSKGYHVSAGYFFSEVSTSEQNFTPAVPDTDLHVGSLGVGRKGKSWDWALAVQMIAGPWRTIDQNVNPTVNGRYKLWTPTFSFSVGYHF